ncbi:MAG: SDR family oxidoreductase [Alphaproteobacteria bacterium]|nr:SDR family oxidoreductase [Alphaproteobacteria bacterium]
MKILVLGASGMIGHTMLRVLSGNKDWDVFGTTFQNSAREFFADFPNDRVISGIDGTNEDRLVQVFANVRPTVVINCIGIIKQLEEAKNPLSILPLNSLLPHRLASLCHITQSRLIQISTDCVFSGKKGNYKEEDIPDATDLYGRSKYLGEVDYPHAITLRTSTIGPELDDGRHNLLGWFLGEQGTVKGYKHAIFSGLPTIEFSRVVRDYVLPQSKLSGLYHIAAKPINKYDLLCLIAKAYGKDIDIIPDDTLEIDRSLNSERFRAATGYVAPEWPHLIEQMQRG